MNGHITTSVLDKKADLFLKLMLLKKNQANTKQHIVRHLTQHQADGYLLFRHSSLYFFVGDKIERIQETVDNYKNANYLRFDGKKVSTLDPEYYLGAGRVVTSTPIVAGIGLAGASTIEFELQNGLSSNNNNNNNNGNNNG